MMPEPQPIPTPPAGPTLADTVADADEYTATGQPQQDYPPDQEQYAPVTTDVLLQSIAGITAQMVPEEKRHVYVAEIVENPVLNTGLELVGTARALNQLAGTGRPMNPYLSVAIGGLMCAVAVAMGVKKHARKSPAPSSYNHPDGGNLHGQPSPVGASEAN